MTTCISSEVSCRADGTDRLTDKTGKGNYSFAKKIKLLVPQKQERRDIGNEITLLNKVLKAWYLIRYL